jgi:hypothetical protein
MSGEYKQCTCETGRRNFHEKTGKIRELESPSHGWKVNIKVDLKKCVLNL